MYQVTESKKTKRTRHDYTPDELSILVAEHSRCPYPNRERRKFLARQLGVSETSILYWFQNRRRADRNSVKSVSPSSKTERRKPYDRPVQGTAQCNSSNNSFSSVDVEASWSADAVPQATAAHCESPSGYYSNYQESPASYNWYYSQYSSPGYYDPSTEYHSTAYPTADVQCWNQEGQQWYPSLPAVNSLPTFDVPFPAYDESANQQQWQWNQGMNYDGYNNCHGYYY